MIGDDSAGTAGNRVFSGSIDDVAVYNRALAKSDLTTLFYSASGVSLYPAEIVASPSAQTLFAGQTATFTVAAGGSDPLSYQWRADTAGNGVYANLVEGGPVFRHPKSNIEHCQYQGCRRQPITRGDRQ